MTNAQKGGVPEISEAAKAKADELLGEWMSVGISLDIRNRFARFIQEVSDAAKAAAEWNCSRDFGENPYLAPFILPEPVDPLLIEAREIAAKQSIAAGHLIQAGEFRKGKWDNGTTIANILAALRRGIEIGGGKP